MYALQSTLADPSSELDSRPPTDIPSISDQSPQNSNSEIIEENKPELIEDHSSNADLSPTLGDSSDFKVVCYFTNWAWFVLLLCIIFYYYLLLENFNNCINIW